MGEGLDKTFGDSNSIVFPAFPSGTKNCETCHGAGTTGFEEPHDRAYPTAPTTTALVWREACSSCHDGDDATAHIDANTSDDVETCGICHAADREFNVATMHKVHGTR